MAETEKVVVLGVKTNDAIKNVRDLRENIKLLKDALNDENLTMEQNADVLTQLRENQNALKDAMYQSSKSTDELIKQSENLNVSYNELVHTMAELKMRWRETSDEAERSRLGEHINEINDKLKEMDASVGNFQRNVGNYSGALEEFGKSMLGTIGQVSPALNGISGQIKSLIPLIKKTTQTATVGLQGIKAAIAETGIGALIIAVGILANKMIEAAKSTEAADAVTRKFTQQQEAAKAATEEYNKKLEENIRLLKATGATDIEVAEEEAKAAKERLDSFNETFQKRMEDAALRDRLFQENDNNTKKEKEAHRKATAEFYQSMYDEQQALLDDYNFKQNALDAAINARLNSINKEAKAAIATREQSLKQQYLDDMYFLQEHGAAQETIEARTKQYLKDLEQLHEQYSAKMKATADQLAKEAKERYEKSKDFYEKWAQSVMNEQRAQYELQVELVKGTKMELAAKIELAKYDLSALYQKEGESAAEYAVRVAKATNALKELENQQAKQDAEEAYNTQHLVFENRMNALMEGSAEYLEAELELKAFELDSLHKLEEESDDEFRARQLEAYKNYQQAKDNLLLAQVASMQRYAGAVSGIMGSIADILETGTEDDLKAAERAKNIRVASATIDTISGAIGAFMQAVKSVPAPYGAILGAIEAAAVTAAGVAQIQKIKATKISANGSGSNSASGSISSTVNAPVIEQAVPQTALVTSASDEEKLNQIGDQKVYILSSDLEANGRKVAIQDSESSF